MRKRRIKYIQIGALIIILTGVLNIIGWYTHNLYLISAFPEFPSMKINTAVNFILTGIALFFSVKPTEGKSRNLLSDTFAWLSLIYVSATFFGYIFNIDIGFGELLIRDYTPHEHPGWMSPFTAFGIFFMNAGLLLSQRESQILQTISQMLFHLATLIAGIIVLGYVYQNELMLNGFDNISAALLSGVTIAICSVCGALLQPKQGVMGLFTGKLSGDKMSQVLFPVITLTLLMLTSVRIFIFRSYYGNDEFVTIIFFIIILVVLLVTIHFTAVKLNRADYKRSIAEGKLQQLNEQLKTTVSEKTRELSQALKLLQFATDSAEIGIWEMDYEEHFITANDVYFQQLGLSRGTEKITSEQIISLIAPEYRDNFTQTIKNVQDKNSQQDIDIELLINTLHNGQRFFRYKGSTISDRNGNVKKVRGIRIDVTKHKETERNLNLAKMLIEKAPSAIAMFDAEMRYVAASEQWLQDYNLQGKHVIEQSLYEIHPFLGEMDKKIHQDALNGIPNVNKEGYCRRLPDGSLRWTTWDIRPWMGTDNKVAGIITHTSDITDRKIAEKKLLESEKLFRANFENSAIGMTMINTDGHWVMVNNALCKMFGYTKEEMLGLTFHEITHPDDLKSNVEVFQKLLDNESDFYTLEKRYIHKNGQTVYAILSSNAIRDENGNIVRIFSQIMDVSKQKKIEHELATNEKLFRANFENSAIGMAGLNTDGRWLMVNDTLCSMLGYTKEELINLTFQQITHPDDLNGNVAALQRILDNKSDYYIIEKRYIHKNGQIVYGILSTTAIRDDNGNIVLMFSHVMDISKQKKAELELAASEEAFRGNFENASIGMALLDLDGNYTKVNRSFSQMLGYPISEFETLNYKDIIHPDDLQKTTRLIENVQRDDFTQLINEIRFFHKDGQIVHAIRSGSAIKNIDGSIKYIIAQCVDITRQKLTDMSLRDILELTEGQNKSLKNFADIVSHNLRSHVGNIQMLNGLFLRKNPQFKDEPVQTLIREATQELLETVFNLNQVKSLKNNMNEMSSVDLYKTVQNTINNISGLVMHAKVKVINDLPEDCQIMGIPAYLDSVVLNFLTNAIKYRSRDRDSFIKLTLTKDKKHLTLNIEDNGLGIDLEKHRHELFKMYKTFHNHEDSRGIGLYITKNQIEAMGGHIDVMSEVNVGTTFKIYFRSAPSKIYINDSIEIDA